MYVLININVKEINNNTDQQESQLLLRMSRMYGIVWNSRAAWHA